MVVYGKQWNTGFNVEHVVMGIIAVNKFTFIFANGPSKILLRNLCAGYFRLCCGVVAGSLQGCLSLRVRLLLVMAAFAF